MHGRTVILISDLLLSLEKKFQPVRLNGVPDMLVVLIRSAEILDKHHADQVAVQLIIRFKGGGLGKIAKLL
jgi:hypothetical protein